MLRADVPSAAKKGVQEISSRDVTCAAKAVSIAGAMLSGNNVVLLSNTTSMGPVELTLNVALQSSPVKPARQEHEHVT